MNKFYDYLWILGKMSGCHQISERSLFFKEKQFPVCARCTGAFIGYLIGGITYFFFNIPVFISLIFCLILFIDWFLQYLKIKQSNNFRRIITGILCGFGLIQIYLKFIKYIFLFL